MMAIANPVHKTTYIGQKPIDNDFVQVLTRKLVRDALMGWFGRPWSMIEAILGGLVSAVARALMKDEICDGQEVYSLRSSCGYMHPFNIWSTVYKRRNPHMPVDQVLDIQSHLRPRP